MAGAAETIHATAIALAGRAALIVGPSGSGKSDLALRCIAHPPGDLFPASAVLVADDQTVLEASDGSILASAPPSIRGKLEIRGLGIMTLPFVAQAPVALVVEPTGRDRVERLPDPWPCVTLGGARFPALRIDPFESSAHLKVLLALSGLMRLGHPDG